VFRVSITDPCEMEIGITEVGSHLGSTREVSSRGHFASSKGQPRSSAVAENPGSITINKEITHEAP
jgi:hypothetical protein